LTVVLATVVLTAPFAAALTSEPARASTPGGITSEIAAAQKKVADLQKQLHTYQDQMANLKPQAAESGH
jgi:F0F1-type ATP synthase membrane subunit b/b'